MPRLLSIYLNDSFTGEYDDLISRYCEAKKIKECDFWRKVLIEYLDRNRRFMDAKITDFESMSARPKHKDCCSECGSSEIDEGGGRIHLKGCIWTK